MNIRGLSGILIALLMVSLLLPSYSVAIQQPRSEYSLSPSDADNNRIDDNLEASNSSLIETIIHLSDNSPIPSHVLGQPVDYVYETISAVSVSLTPSQIDQLPSLDMVTYAEENLKLQPYLLDSTEHFGVVSSFWDQGLIGSDQVSIAVLDTGIDDSHPAFDGKIIASYNAIDNNRTPAMDTHGHGTHVAGIAAGAPSYSTNTYQETSRGVLPSECSDNSCPLNVAFQLPEITSDQSISLTLDWAEEGSDQPGSVAGFAIFDPDTGQLACEDCNVASSTGKLEFNQNINPGSYYVGVLNQANGVDQPFEIALQYSKPSFGGGENPAAAGVAYGANIVNVKVLEGLDGGNLDVFDRGVSWVIEHREMYNITVVNLSLGLNQTSVALDSMMAKIADNGILPVVAAGNSGQFSDGVFSPASAPEALTVGSMNRIGEVTFYTNVGSDEVNGEFPKPDVIAPGGSVASQGLGFKTGYDLGYGLIIAPDANIGINLNQNDLVGHQGTSMAAPHIAGLVAIISSQQITSWNWNSRDTVMDIKRKILAGTYEVANIGYGREQLPSAAEVAPTLDHGIKDYHEGWGAVDARAVHSLFSDEIDLGYSAPISLDLTDPKKQKAQGWKMTIQPGILYGFVADGTAEADVDVRLISATGGPLHDGQDYGDLTILASTDEGNRDSEGLGYSVSKPTDVYIMVSIVNGSTPTGSTFSVKEIGSIPTVEITQPFEGQTVENPVTVEFTSSEPVSEIYLDGTFIDESSGSITLDQLSLGNHTVKVVSTSDEGISSTSKLTFSVVENVTTDFFLLSPSLAIISVSLMILVIKVRYSHKFN